MLPPPPTAILSANPNFANLYQHLTENILAHDGSTLSKTKEYDAVTNHLNAARQAAARDEILLRGLEEIALEGNDNELDSGSSRPAGTGNVRSETSGQHDMVSLPPELREMIYNVTSYLAASLNSSSSETLPEDTDELMADELATIRQHQPEIAKALSAHLSATESTLTALSKSLQPNNPASKPSTARSRGLPAPADRSLSATLSTTGAAATINHDTSLPKALTDTTHSLTTALNSHTQTLHHHIRQLELTTHGTTSRHTAARANYLSTISRGIELKARIMSLEAERALYGDQNLMDSLESEGDALSVEEGKLQRRERELEGLLVEYDREGAQARIGGGRGRNRGNGEGSGEDVFCVLGERYAEVEREIEEVKRDIGRLKTKVLEGR